MGAFGKKSTAEEVAEGKDLSSKTVIITGGSAGMGYETVKVLAKAGARVLLCCRNTEAGKKAADGLEGNISVHHMDLEDLASVKAFYDSIADTIPNVHVLICNAGVMGIPTKTITKDGFESHMAANHFGHMYLTELLLPKLKASGTPQDPARIIFVSSLSHIGSRMKVEWTDFSQNFTYEKRKYLPMQAYCDAKLANILYVRELSKKLIAEGAYVKAVALHPGMVLTGFAGNLTGVSKYVTKAIGWFIGKTPAQGAATAVYAATAPDVPTGSYLENCGISKPSPTALDDEFSKKFYDRSEVLLNEAIKVAA